MTQRLDLTAVIATYNRGHLLGGVLAALAGQQTPPSLRWEVIVVDKNSRDHTPRVVADMTARMPDAHSIRARDETGMSHAECVSPVVLSWGSSTMTCCPGPTGPPAS
jgi:glycosyltransferase involved in cell wall biosynthesis